MIIIKKFYRRLAVFFAPMVLLTWANDCSADCSFFHSLECVTPITACWPALAANDGRESFFKCVDGFSKGYCDACIGFANPRKKPPYDDGDPATQSIMIAVPVLLSNPVSGPNLDGRLELAASSADGVLFHLWQTEPGWSGSPANFPGSPQVRGPATVVQRGLGPLEVFGVAPNGHVGYVEQLAPNVNWGSWHDLGGQMHGPVAAALQTYSSLTVAAIGDDGLYYISREPSLGTWTSMGGAFSGTPAVGLNNDGRLELFATSGNNLLHKWELAPGGAWSDWERLGGGVMNDPVAIQNKDGRIAVFVTTEGGGLRLFEQSAGNAGWLPAFDFSGQHSGHPAVTRNQDGTLEVFVVGVNDRSVYHASQVHAGKAFGPFSSIGGKVQSSPAVAAMKNGKLAVFGIGDDYAVWDIEQQSKSSWGKWTRLGGTATPSAF